MYRLRSVQYMVPIWIGVFVLVGAMHVVHVAYKLLEALGDLFGGKGGS